MQTLTRTRVLVLTASFFALTMLSASSEVSYAALTAAQVTSGTMFDEKVTVEQNGTSKREQIAPYDRAGLDKSVLEDDAAKKQLATQKQIVVQKINEINAVPTGGTAEEIAVNNLRRSQLQAQLQVAQKIQAQDQLIADEKAKVRKDHETHAGKLTYLDKATGKPKTCDKNSDSDNSNLCVRETVPGGQPYSGTGGVGAEPGSAPQPTTQLPSGSQATAGTSDGVNAAYGKPSSTTIDPNNPLASPTPEKDVAKFDAALGLQSPATAGGTSPVSEVKGSILPVPSGSTVAPLDSKIAGSVAEHQTVPSDQSSVFRSSADTFAKPCSGFCGSQTTGVVPVKDDTGEIVDLNSHTLVQTGEGERSLGYLANKYGENGVLDLNKVPGLIAPQAGNGSGDRGISIPGAINVPDSRSFELIQNSTNISGGFLGGISNAGQNLISAHPSENLSPGSMYDPLGVQGNPRGSGTAHSNVPRVAAGGDGNGTGYGDGSGFGYGGFGAVFGGGLITPEIAGLVSTIAGFFDGLGGGLQRFGGGGIAREGNPAGGGPVARNAGGSPGGTTPQGGVFKDPAIARLEQLEKERVKGKPIQSRYGPAPAGLNVANTDPLLPPSPPVVKIPPPIIAKLPRPQSMDDFIKAFSPPAPAPLDKTSPEEQTHLDQGKSNTKIDDAFNPAPETTPAKPSDANNPSPPPTPFDKLAAGSLEPKATPSGPSPIPPQPKNPGTNPPLSTPAEKTSPETKLAQKVPGPSPVPEQTRADKNNQNPAPQNTYVPSSERPKLQGPFGGDTLNSQSPTLGPADDKKSPLQKVGDGLKKIVAALNPMSSANASEAPSRVKNMLERALTFGIPPKPTQITPAANIRGASQPIAVRLPKDAQGNVINPHNIRVIDPQKNPPNTQQNIAFCIGVPDCPAPSGTLKITENNYVSMIDTKGDHAAIDSKLDVAVKNAEISGGIVEIDCDTHQAATCQYAIGAANERGLKPWVNEPQLLDGPISGHKGSIFEEDSNEKTKDTIALVRASAADAGNPQMPILAVGTKKWTAEVAAQPNAVGIGTSASKEQGDTPGAYNDYEGGTPVGNPSGALRANTLEECDAQTGACLEGQLNGTDADKAAVHQELKEQLALTRMANAGLCTNNCEFKEMTAQKDSVSNVVPSRVVTGTVGQNAFVKNPDVAAFTPTKEQEAAAYTKAGIDYQDISDKYTNYHSRASAGGQVDAAVVHGDLLKGGQIIDHCTTTSICYNKVIGDGTYSKVLGENTVPGRLYVMGWAADSAPSHAAGISTHSDSVNLPGMDSSREGAVYNAPPVLYDTAKKLVGTWTDDFGWHVGTHGGASNFSHGGRNSCEGGCNVRDMIYAGSFGAPAETYTVTDITTGTKYPGIVLPAGSSDSDGKVRLALDSSNNFIRDTSGKPTTPDSVLAEKPVEDPNTGRITYPPALERIPPVYTASPDPYSGGSTGGMASDNAGNTGSPLAELLKFVKSMMPQNKQSGSKPGQTARSQPSASPQINPTNPPAPLPPPPPPIVFNTTLEPVISCSPSVVIVGPTASTTVSWTCFEGTAQSAGFPANNHAQAKVNVSLANVSSRIIRTMSVRCASGQAVSAVSSCTVRTIKPAVTMSTSLSEVALDGIATLEWRGDDVDRCNLYAPGPTLIAQGGSVATLQTPHLQRSVVLRILCQSSAGPTVGSSVTIRVAGDARVPLDTPVPANPFNTMAPVPGDIQIPYIAPTPTPTVTTVPVNSTQPPPPPQSPPTETPCNPEVPVHEFIACLQSKA